jgi:hypothetical protein
MVDFPISPTSFVLPQVQAAVEAQANYIWYFDDEIEPSYMQYIPVTERAYPNTPEIYKAMSRGAIWAKGVPVLGGALGSEDMYGPLRIRHMIRSGIAPQIDDWMRFQARVESGEIGTVDLVNPLSEDNPTTGRLWQRPPIGWRSESVSQVLQKAEEYDARDRRIQRITDEAERPIKPHLREQIREDRERLQELDDYKTGLAMIEAQWDRVKEARDQDRFDQAAAIEEQMTKIAQNTIRRAEENRQRREQREAGQ